MSMGLKKGDGGAAGKTAAPDNKANDASKKKAIAKGSADFAEGEKKLMPDTKGAAQKQKKGGP